MEIHWFVKLILPCRCYCSDWGIVENVLVSSDVKLLKQLEKVLSAI